MKHILLFGAGKSATVLIDYLIANAGVENWHITIVDAQLETIEKKTRKAACTTAAALDVRDENLRQQFIRQSDLVISLLPPALHLTVAKDCLQYGKNLLTASYAGEDMKALSTEAANKGLLFLCEMGLDPGIDHMSAVQMINAIRQEEGNITAFYSHCGGLVAPESDNNPWHYKISWNPRNVVMAGKGGAVYKLNGQEIHESYEELFDKQDFIEVDSLEPLSWYPNRNSLSYIPLYGLENCDTFLRSTLRPAEFCFGWKNIVNLKLTDETQFYDTDGLSISGFLQQHFNNNGFAEWITEQLTANLSSVTDLLKKTLQLLEKEEEMKRETEEEGNKENDGNFLMVDDKGKLQNVNIDDAKLDVAQGMAARLYENNLLLKQLFFLGMDDDETLINKGRCSAADVLQFILEEKLPLLPEDKDMVIMQHEIEYETGEGKFQKTATLVLKGEDGIRTAMAKTVGLPLGIAARLILNGKISLKGVQIPIHKEIYEPVLRELAVAGIEFKYK